MLYAHVGGSRQENMTVKIFKKLTEKEPPKNFEFLMAKPQLTLYTFSNVIMITDILYNLCALKYLRR